MFPQSHAPSCLFISLCIHPEKKTKCSLKRCTQIKEFLTFIASQHSILLSFFLLLHHLQAVSVQIWEDSAVLLVEGSPRQHSCVWVVHRRCSETQSSKRLSITFHLRLTYSWRQNKQAQKLAASDITMKKNNNNVSEKSTGESAWHLTRHISVVGFFVCTSNLQARLNPPTAQVIHTVITVWRVYPQSRCKSDTDAKVGLCFELFFIFIIIAYHLPRKVSPVICFLM